MLLLYFIDKCVLNYSESKVIVSGLNARKISIDKP